MRWLIAILFSQMLVSGGLIRAQGDLVRIPCGDGFSTLRAVTGPDGRWYAQGTLPDQMFWDGRPIGSGGGTDLFFAVADPVTGLEWSSVLGGGGVERIHSKPLIGPDGNDWFFYGEAIDSLRLGDFIYRPSLSSFFTFIGMQSTTGVVKNVRALESSGPLEVLSAVWTGRDDRIVISGKAEAPVVSGSDTLIHGPNGNYAFIALIDTALSVLNVQVITGFARPFDLLYQDGQVMAGFSIRDLIQFEGQVVQARVQDLDCLVTAWDDGLSGLQWFHKLGGVYDKNGVALVRGRDPGSTLVAGHFIGTISDGTGLEYQSNGFEPDLFAWEFSSTGQVLYGSATGGSGNEELKALMWHGDTLEWLIQFREAFHFFGHSFRTSREGYHLARLTMGTSGELLSRDVILGDPDVFGFDLIQRGNKFGVVGGFSQEVTDTLGRILLQKEGAGPVDYFIRFRPDGVSTRDVFSARSISVYPNPASDELRIFPVSPLPEEGVLIFDLTGRLMLRTFSNPVDIRALAPGTYLLSHNGALIQFVKY